MYIFAHHWEWSTAKPNLSFIVIHGYKSYRIQHSHITDEFFNGYAALAPRRKMHISLSNSYILMFYSFTHHNLAFYILQWLSFLQFYTFNWEILQFTASWKFILHFTGQGFYSFTQPISLFYSFTDAKMALYSFTVLPLPPLNTDHRFYCSWSFYWVTILLISRLYQIANAWK